MDTGWALEELWSASWMTILANETELGESGACLMWYSRVSRGIFMR